MLVGNWLVSALLVDEGKTGNVGVLRRDGSQDAISALFTESGTTYSISAEIECATEELVT